MPNAFVGVDLHTHTTASDGNLSPQALVELAIHNQTNCLAITDHDTIAGYLSVRDNIPNGLQLIAGVELSTQWHGIGIHIVGLNIDVSHDSMLALLASQSAVRETRSQQILSKLAKLNMPIDGEELQALVGNGQIGRPHIAQLMLGKGYVSSIDQAFKKYLGAGKIGDIKNAWVSLAEAVAAVHASGGIAVIAHPNQYKMTRSKQMRLLDDFQSAGGQAIEVISGRQHQDITKKWAHIALERGLYASIGSDFHRVMPYAAQVGQIQALPETVTPIWEQF